jgi:hypothetical protein
VASGQQEQVAMDAAGSSKVAAGADMWARAHMPAT